jgi:hypothetical protein
MTNYLLASALILSVAFGLKWLFRCRHDEMIREIGSEGRLFLRCSACGHCAPALKRDTDTRQHLRLAMGRKAR